jgi:uncharacterized protein (TIGR02118 family)
MMKLTIMLARRGDISREQFSHYWLNEHAPKILALTGADRVIKGYVQQVSVRDIPEGLPVADFDGMAELWFDDLQSALTIMSSDQYRATIPPDEPNFLDQSKTRIMFSEERRCI